MKKIILISIFATIFLNCFSQSMTSGQAISAGSHQRMLTTADWTNFCKSYWNIVDDGSPASVATNSLTNITFISPLVMNQAGSPSYSYTATCPTCLTGSLTVGSVFFSGGGQTVTQDNSNFFWDNTNKRLTIGSHGGGYPLMVTNTSTVTASPVFGVFSNGGLNRFLVQDNGYTQINSTAGNLPSSGSTLTGVFLAFDPPKKGMLFGMDLLGGFIQCTNPGVLGSTCQLSLQQLGGNIGIGLGSGVTAGAQVDIASVGSTEPLRVTGVGNSSSTNTASFYNLGGSTEFNLRDDLTATLGGNTNIYGTITSGVSSVTTGEIDFYNSSNGNKVGLKAGVTNSTTPTFTLPIADGAAGAVMTTDGSGNLSFTTAIPYVPPTDWSGTIAFTGYSVAPDVAYALYSVVGSQVTIEVSFGLISGTSNTTSLTILNLPYAGRTGIQQDGVIASVEDNGAVSYIPGTCQITSGSTTLYINKSALVNFTAASTKGARFIFTYYK